ncbi:hypothetical protein LY76DRAFT_165245 [Colletotrichum caudatum]|nr:hypothetical protein LY76DRAFT_165245 [Colletotrichum caudatum]
MSRPIQRPVGVPFVFLGFIGSAYGLRTIPRVAIASASRWFRPKARRRVGGSETAGSEPMKQIAVGPVRESDIATPLAAADSDVVRGFKSGSAIFETHCGLSAPCCSLFSASGTDVMESMQFCGGESGGVASWCVLKELQQTGNERLNGSTSCPEEGCVIIASGLARPAHQRLVSRRRWEKGDVENKIKHHIHRQAQTRAHGLLLQLENGPACRWRWWGGRFCLENVTKPISCLRGIWDLRSNNILDTYDCKARLVG